MDSPRADAIELRPAAASDSIRLLWTSGWDSTFQLLRVLLRHRLPVTPYYLEDETRASSAIELITMQKIREALAEAHPHTHHLLQPLQHFRVADVRPHSGVTDALRAVRRRMYIGSQYEWLAAFVQQHDLHNIELSVHVDDKVQALIASQVETFDQAGAYGSHRFDAAHADTPEHVLFGRFSFPLFGIDKPGMGEEARREGWTRFMEMTWFCHRPIHARPCGVCAPCVYAIEEGMAWRVPRSRRVLSYPIRTFVRPLKPMLRSALHRIRGI